MISNNEQRVQQYQMLKPYADRKEGNVAKVPGMDSYPDPENPGQMKAHEGTLDTQGSLFNPLYRFNVADAILTNADFKAKRGQHDYEPTLENLLNQDNMNNPGLRYDTADFMFCKYAENVSGYHLITLRRFANPVEDGLGVKDNPSIDVGRLVTYSTEEENKLSEIMTMTFGLRWKELTADFWTPEVIGDERGASGILGTMFEVTNPMFMANKGLGKNAINVDPQHDQNKVYGPVDSITQTHIRDRGLNFEQEISLTFEYDLMAYADMNPKAAMLDLISNILAVTFNDAKFWGGAIKWRGMARGAYAHYLSATDAMKAGKDFNSTVSYYKNAFKSLNVNSIMDAVNLLLKGLGGFALDKLVTSLGRPTVAVANSLLSGEPVGTWHLTIGNPFRPIVTIGNLLLTSSTLSFGDTLGHDGFPTTIKLTCQLKHAKPRSRAEIEMMFNQGMARTYWQPDKDTFTKAVNKSYAYRNKSGNLLKELSDEVYAFLENPNLKNW